MIKRQKTGWRGYLWVLLLLYLVISPKVTFSQINALRPFKTIRALVVGVSDYQSEEISDLSFADADAEAFATLLREGTEWQAKAEDVALLTNENATYGAFVAELERLTATSSAGDRIILYFAGHGDVESVREEKMGYLLFHDAPGTTYAAGGACMVNTLDEAITKLIQDRGVEVILVVDACRSGSLAGADRGGPEATAAALNELFSKTVKILSSEPTELSLEKPDLGGGRGLFSFYLESGLQGAADINNDRFINLFEIERYVQNEVMAASDFSQTPSAKGPMKLKISKIARRQTPPDPAEVAVVAPDTSDEQRIAAFRDAVAADHLLEPYVGSAFFHYQRLKEENPDNFIASLLKTQLITELQTKPQQALEVYISSPGKELANRWAEREAYQKYPAHLAKAAELLGPESAFARDVESRSHYFRGLNLRLGAERLPDGKEVVYRQALAEQEKALELVSRSAAPHVYNELGFIEVKLGNREEALAHFQRAHEQSPEWALPVTNLAVVYEKSEEYPKAEEFYRMAIEMDEDLSLAHYNLGYLYELMERPEDAAKAYHQAIGLPQPYPLALYNLAYLYLDDSTRYEESEALFLRYLVQEPNDAEAYQSLSYLYHLMGRIEDYRAAVLQASALNPNDYVSLFNAAAVLAAQGDTTQAVAYYQHASEVDTEDYMPHYEIGKLYAAQGNQAEALAALERSLRLGLDDQSNINEMEEFDGLRESTAYKALMEKYFPK